MSLDYDLTDLDPALRAEFFPPDADGKMHNHLHDAIFTTMAVGIYKVTLQNYHEFWQRQIVWKKAVGPLYQEIVSEPTDPKFEQWVPIVLTLDECRALVGLGTNAAKLTRTQFYTKMWDAVDSNGWTERKEHHKRFAYSGSRNTSAGAR